MNQTTPQFTWNSIDLEALRQVMDKPSDDAVETIYHPKSKSMRDLAAILKKLAENDDEYSPDLPSALHDSLDTELQKSFSEEDIEKFNRTHEIWKEHGMNFVFILFSWAFRIHTWRKDPLMFCTEPNFLKRKRIAGSSKQPNLFLMRCVRLAMSALHKAKIMNRNLRLKHFKKIPKSQLKLRTTDRVSLQKLGIKFYNHFLQLKKEHKGQVWDYR